jgi:glucosyl-dolichyl phosphate glucuronosyltransferase
MAVRGSGMFLSIVVCTHSLENYPNLIKAVESLLEQTYREREIIVAVDGNPELYTRFVSRYESRPEVRAVLLEKNSGVSAARNAGVRVAGGEVIAFMDDDAMADKDWLKELLVIYKACDAVAVGGKILPVWPERRPDYLPEELYWLVGATNAGFAGEKVTEVRNAYGPNMSFRRQVFREVGLFSPVFGFLGNSYIQAEEPELAIRMKHKFGKGVIYNPKAIVHHLVPAAKLKVGCLLKRSFYQGYSKALVRKLDASADSIDTEKSYLKYLLLDRIPRRMARAYHPAELKKVFILVASVTCVVLGFTYCYLKRTSISKTSLTKAGYASR